MAGGDPAAVQVTWRRLSTPREAVRPRCRDGWCVSLASGQLAPEGFQFLGMSCNESKGTGERCTLAHIDSKSTDACNEIKLPVRSSTLNEPPVTGTLALQDVRRRSQSNEKDR